MTRERFDSMLKSRSLCFNTMLTPMADCNDPLLMVGLNLETPGMLRDCSFDVLSRELMGGLEVAPVFSDSTSPTYYVGSRALFPRLLS